MTLNSVILSDFRIVLPSYCVQQDESLQWLARRHLSAQAAVLQPSQTDRGLPLTVENEERLLKLFSRYGVSASQIHSRSVDCPDVLEKNWDKPVIYQIRPESPSGTDISGRHGFYSKRVQEVFRSIYLNTNAEAQPEHLIHVTCTGYLSPSAAQILVSEKLGSGEWRKSTEVTHAYHMGCYAALPAIRLGEALVLRNGKKKDSYGVDIVHTEICSLHMNPLDHSPEQIVVQSLFGDGHIKYSIKMADQKLDQPGLKVLLVKEWTLPGSQKDMSWQPASWGMQMTLSREVPDKVCKSLKVATHEMCNELGMDYDQIQRNAIFAIHPGGPKIIEMAQRVLELRDEQVKTSKKVLMDRGNMSSATLPHIWKEILDLNPAHGTRVISFAFGPGLTIFGALFEVHRP